MRDEKVFTPKKIFEPIGMTGDRFRYIVKLGIVSADAKKATQSGAPNKFTATEACKAALVNWADHIGFDLATSEALIKFAFSPNVLKLITAGEVDYYAMSQGHTVIAMLPNVEQLPGGPEFGRKYYPVESCYEIRPMKGVTLFTPVQYKDIIVKGATVTYTNMSELFRFFGKRIGFSLNDLIAKED